MSEKHENCGLDKGCTLEGEGDRKSLLLCTIHHCILFLARSKDGSRSPDNITFRDCNLTTNNQLDGTSFDWNFVFVPVIFLCTFHVNTFGTFRGTYGWRCAKSLSPCCRNTKYKINHQNQAGRGRKKSSSHKKFWTAFMLQELAKYVPTGIEI